VNIPAMFTRNIVASNKGINSYPIITVCNESETHKIYPNKDGTFDQGIYAVLGDNKDKSCSSYNGITKTEYHNI
jgi:hypothetical protein